LSQIIGGSPEEFAAFLKEDTALGLVKAIDAESGELVVDFDGREVAYDFGEPDELVLAYATTVHKAQVELL